MLKYIKLGTVLAFAFLAGCSFDENVTQIRDQPQMEAEQTKPIGQIEYMHGLTHRKDDKSLNVANQGTPMPIPPILEDKNPSPNKGEYHLIAQHSMKEFAKGLKAETYGYNGSYLGPVIRMKKGEEVSVKIKNSLDESTTVHWHGMEIPGEMDGGPHNGIQPGEVWNPRFTVNQPAATLWFHPHPMHRTGEQVYKGLAGLVYIDDEDSEKLNIPKDYG